MEFEYLQSEGSSPSRRNKTPNTARTRKETGFARGQPPHPTRRGLTPEQAAATVISGKTK
jgi:hypothetical protein